MREKGSRIKRIKYILISMFFFPNVAFAYLATFEGYDLQKCLHIKFSEQGYSGILPSEPGIHGSIRKAEGKGDTIYFKGTYKAEGKVWTFNGDSNFPLVGSSFKHTGVATKCIKGCSKHGVEYLFETSDEGSNTIMWKFLKEYKLKVKSQCPSLRI